MDPEPPAAAGETLVAAIGAAQAAIDTMNSALATLRSYSGDRRNAISTRSAELAAELRARADRDLAHLSEGAEAEIARIRQQTASAVSARQAALEAQLAQEQARRDGEFQNTETDLVAFDAEVSVFEAQTLAFLARVSAGRGLLEGSPPIGPEAPTASSGEGSQAPATAGEGSDEPVGTTDPERADKAVTFGIADDLPTEPESPAAESTEPEPMTRPQSSQPLFQGPVSLARPSRGSEPESDAPEAGATMVSVRGLLDIASIATFMRPLSRTSGIESVQIRSVQNGEVSFAIVTEPGVDLPGAIRATPHFDIEVLEEGPGRLTILATDTVSAKEATRP